MGMRNKRWGTWEGRNRCVTCSMQEIWHPWYDGRPSVLAWPCVEGPPHVWSSLRTPFLTQPLLFPQSVINKSPFFETQNSFYTSVWYKSILFYITPHRWFINRLRKIFLDFMPNKPVWCQLRWLCVKMGDCSQTELPLSSDEFNILSTASFHKTNASYSFYQQIWSAVFTP